MRRLSDIEQQRIRLLTENSVSFSLIEPTETGLKKSILDATGPVRNYLEDEGIHKYDIQKQGPLHKIQVKATLLEPYAEYKSLASLYRPKTKKGDPRIWFKGLSRISGSNDILAIIAHDKQLFILNLTHIHLDEILLDNGYNPIKGLIQEIKTKEGATSDELLFKLKQIASRGPIKALVDADTAVGRTLEAALGIEINSSKKPDYKGIELKSFRNNRGNRKNLFAQVAKWSESKFKSSSEILDAFGYWRGDDFKLYCTVSTTNRNSQGLKFKVDTDINHLIENSDKPEINDFAVWPLKMLHRRLLEKHNETFWISTDSVIEDGNEYFQYVAVEHTRKPIVSQFDLLLDQGIITMDHLIKRNGQGKVVEKGPLFKIKPDSLGLLFPPSSKYDLLK